MTKRPYNPDGDSPATRWDASNIEYYLSIGEKLIVDKNGEVWTVGREEYVGKIATS